MPIKHFFVCSLMIICSLGEAQIYLWPVEIRGRGERNEAQSLEFKSNQFPSFGASMIHERFIFSLDFSKFQSESENGNILIKTTYSDVVISAGYSLFSGDIWDFYGTIATGVYVQKINTEVSGLLATSNKSNDRNLVGLGAEYVVQTPFLFSTTVGGRLNWTQDLDPEIMPEVYIKLGAGFF